MHPEASEDGGQVVAHGVLTEKQLTGYDRGPLAGHEPLEYLVLARGEFGQHVEIPRIGGVDGKGDDSGGTNFRGDPSQPDLEVAHTVRFVRVPW